MIQKKEKKQTNSKRSRHALASFRRFGFLSLTLALSSCLLPNTASPKESASKEDDQTSSKVNDAINGAQALAQSLTNAIASGFKMSLNEAILQADDKNQFDFSGGSLSFGLTELSLHGLSVALNAPVNYNGIGNRSIDATLVNDELYFSLCCPKESGDPYSVSYKVSTASYTYDVNGDSHDSTTGGIYQYEFGRLDWIIDDILQILSGYGYSITPKTDNSKVTFDWSKISSSLDEMSEISAGSRYFLWNLPLGENIYPIGLQGDENYSLSAIDFPAKGVSGATGELSNGMKLQLSASFETEGVAVLPPSDSSSYLVLDNSIDLWERLATYAGKLAFSVSSQHTEGGVVKEGLLLTHKEDAVDATETTIGHAAIDESAIFNIEGSGDFKGGKVNALNAKASFLGENESKYLSAVLSDGDQEKNICLDVNGIVKARTSKTTADAFFSAFSGLLGDESISNKYLSNLLATANSISSAIDSIKESQVGKDISEGHYEHLIAIISKIEAKDNSIVATLDLSKAGSSGTLTLVLSGKEKHLAEITFSGFTLGYFGVDGTLSIGDYSTPESFDPSEYPLMDHLPSLSDQIESLFQHHSAKATIQGYVLDRGTQAVSSDTRFASIGGKSSIVEQGFSFEGSFAFNLKEKAGGGSGVFLDRKADYLNEHSISLQIDGDEESNGNMLFGYNSKNSKHNSGEEGYKDLDYGNITEPDSDVGSMYGRFSVASLNDLLGCFSSLLNSTDPRFTKFTSAKDTIATTLIAKIAQGQIAPLLTEKILLSCIKNGDTIDAVISKSLFGSETDVALRLGFGQNGLSLIRLSFSTNEKEIFFQIGVEVPDKELTKNDLLLSELESNKSKATDYSDLPTLVDYLLGSATLGEDANHQSTYHISGSATLSLLFTLTVNIDAFIALRGAEVLAMGSVTVPMVIGVNTSNLLGGTRYCEFYFHTSGTDKDGTLFFHRTDDITSLGNDSESYAKVKSSDFSANIANWLLGYVVGLTDSMMDKVTSSSSKDEKGSSLHGEELIRKYSFEKLSAGAKWGLSLDLSSLSSVLSDQIALTIEGKEVNANGGKEKTLSSVSGSTKILKSLLGISFNFSLANVSTGDYKSVWIKNSSSEDDIIGIAYLTSKKKMASKKVHAADYYSEVFYNEGYVTTGSFASANFYTEKYTG